MSNLEKLLQELQTEEPVNYRGASNESATRKQMKALEPLFVEAMSKRGRNGKFHTGRSFYEKVKDTPEFTKLRSEYGQSEAKYRAHFIAVFNDFRVDCVSRGLVPSTKGKTPAAVRVTPKFQPSTSTSAETSVQELVVIEQPVVAPAAPAPTPVVETPKPEVPVVKAEAPKPETPRPVAAAPTQSLRPNRLSDI